MRGRYLRTATGKTDQGTELFVIRSLEEEEFFQAVAAAIAACGPYPDLRVTITCLKWNG